MQFYCGFRENSLSLPNSRLNNHIKLILILAEESFIERMGITNTTDKSFEQDVISSEIPVLVDFWAEWCGPCKMIGPILEQLDNEIGDKIKIVKVDVDNNNQTAMKFAIRSIPTLIIVKEGAVIAQHIGAASKAQLENFINQNI